MITVNKSEPDSSSEGPPPPTYVAFPPILPTKGFSVDVHKSKDPLSYVLTTNETFEEVPEREPIRHINIIDLPKLNSTRQNKHRTDVSVFDGPPPPGYVPTPPNCGPPAPRYVPNPPSHLSFFEPPPPNYVPQPPDISPLERYGIPPRKVLVAGKTECRGCNSPFGSAKRYHCGCCGYVFCGICTKARIEFPIRYGYSRPERICTRCVPKIVDMLHEERKKEPTENDSEGSN